MGIARDIFEILDENIDGFTDQFMKRLDATHDEQGSLAKRAADGTLFFPVLVSRAIEYPIAQKVCKACEINAASFAQIVLTMNPKMDLTTGKGAVDYIRKFHSNVDTEEDIFGSAVHSLNRMGTTEAFIIPIYTDSENFKICKEELKEYGVDWREGTLNNVCEATYLHEQTVPVTNKAQIREILKKNLMKITMEARYYADHAMGLKFKIPDDQYIAASNGGGSRQIYGEDANQEEIENYDEARDITTIDPDAILVDRKAYEDNYDNDDDSNDSSDGGSSSARQSSGSGGSGSSGGGNSGGSGSSGGSGGGRSGSSGGGNRSGGGSSGGSGGGRSGGGNRSGGGSSGGSGGGNRPSRSSREPRENRPRREEIETRRERTRVPVSRERERNRIQNVDVVMKDILKDQDVKRANELQPILLHIRVIGVDSKDGVTGQYIDFLVGVKGTMHPIPSAEMITELVKACRYHDEIFRFIRWTTGEISFLGDFLLNMKDSRKSIERQSSGGSPWFNRLRRMSVIGHFKKRMFMKHKVLPNASIAVSQQEVDQIKSQYGFDLMDPKFVKEVMDKFFLLCFIVIDDALEVVHFKYDSHKSYTTLSFSGLERQNSDSVRQFREILKAVQRV